MAFIALEVIKVRESSTGKEIAYEPKTDVATIVDGVLVESAKVWDTTTKSEYLIEAGEPTSNIPPVAIVSSTIEDAEPTDIVITFDGEPSFDINNIVYRVNGGSALTPVSVQISGVIVVVTMQAAAINTDTINWSRNNGGTWFDVTNNVL